MKRVSMADEISCTSSLDKGSSAPRIMICSLIATLCAAAAGTAVWSAIPRQYTSVATLHIRRVAPSILYPTEASEGPELYDSFCDVQIELIKSRRVIEVAMHSEIWKSAHLGN